MNKEQLRMQMFAGVITEGEYKAKLEELNSTEEKDSLNEGIVGGIVGIGAITQIPPRTKESYEDAFEHFLSERYETKFENREQDLEEDKDPDVYEGEINENVGSTIDKILSSFEFSQKGNDEMIELANYILTPEGAKNIAMSLKNRLKGEGGENYFTSKPEALQSLLDKLR